MFYWPLPRHSHGVDPIRRPSYIARLWDPSCPNATLHITGPSSIDSLTNRYQFECVEELIANLAKLFFAHTVSHTNRHHFTVNDSQTIQQHERWTGCQEHNAIPSTIRTTIIKDAIGHATANIADDGTITEEAETKARRSTILPHEFWGNLAFLSSPFRFLSSSLSRDKLQFINSFPPVITSHFSYATSLDNKAASRFILFIIISSIDLFINFNLININLTNYSSPRPAFCL